MPQPWPYVAVLGVGVGGGAGAVWAPVRAPVGAVGPAGARAPAGAAVAAARDVVAAEAVEMVAAAIRAASYGRDRSVFARYEHDARQCGGWTGGGLHYGVFGCCLLPRCGE